MTARCPVCRGELVVGGDDITEGGTRFWWCPYCQEARDPAPESGQASGVTSTGEGEGNTSMNRRFHEDIRETDRRDPSMGARGYR